MGLDPTNWPDHIIETATATKHVMALLVGHSGMGKTRFCGTSPEPRFWLNTDKGLQTLAQLGDNEPWRIDLSRGRLKATKVVLEILRAIKHSEGPFKERQPATVIIDSLTQLSVLLELEFGDGERGMTLPEYNIHKLRMTSILSLLQDLPCHVICTTTIEYVADEATKRLEEWPAMTGVKMGPRTPPFFGEVYYMGYNLPKEKAGRWFLSTELTGRFSAGKSRILEGRQTINDPTWDKVMVKTK